MSVTVTRATAQSTLTDLLKPYYLHFLTLPRLHYTSTTRRASYMPSHSTLHQGRNTRTRAQLPPRPRTGPAYTTHGGTIGPTTATTLQHPRLGLTTPTRSSRKQVRTHRHTQTHKHTQSRTHTHNYPQNTRTTPRQHIDREYVADTQQPYCAQHSTASSALPHTPHTANNTARRRQCVTTRTH